MPSTQESTIATVINSIIYFKYLRKINENISIGRRIDLIDFYFRKTLGLGNNGTNYINGHHLYGSISRCLE